MKEGNNNNSNNVIIWYEFDKENEERIEMLKEGTIIRTENNDYKVSGMICKSEYSILVANYGCHFKLEILFNYIKEIGVPIKKCCETCRWSYMNNGCVNNTGCDRYLRSIGLKGGVSCCANYDFCSWEPTLKPGMKMYVRSDADKIKIDSCSYVSFMNIFLGKEVVLGESFSNIEWFHGDDMTNGVLHEAWVTYKPQIILPKREMSFDECIRHYGYHTGNEMGSNKKTEEMYDYVSFSPVINYSLEAMEVIHKTNTKDNKLENLTLIERPVDCSETQTVETQNFDIEVYIEMKNSIDDENKNKSTASVEDWYSMYMNILDPKKRMEVQDLYNRNIEYEKECEVNLHSDLFDFCLGKKDKMKTDYRIIREFDFEDVVVKCTSAKLISDLYITMKEFDMNVEDFTFTDWRRDCSPYKVFTKNVDWFVEEEFIEEVEVCVEKGCEELHRERLERLYFLDNCLRRCEPVTEHGSSRLVKSRDMYIDKLQYINYTFEFDDGSVEKIQP